MGERNKEAREAIAGQAREERDWRLKVAQKTGRDPVTGKREVESAEKIAETIRKDHLRHNGDMPET